MYDKDYLDIKVRVVLEEISQDILCKICNTFTVLQYNYLEVKANAKKSLFKVKRYEQRYK